jgi:hypothetical protein
MLSKKPCKKLIESRYVNLILPWAEKAQLDFKSIKIKNGKKSGCYNLKN